jgi:hypothetical protein
MLGVHDQRSLRVAFLKQKVYADTHFSGPLWRELYDSNLKLWRFYEVVPQGIDVPGIGPQN